MEMDMGITNHVASFTKLVRLKTIGGIAWDDSCIISRGVGVPGSTVQ